MFCATFFFLNTNKTSMECDAQGVMIQVFGIGLMFYVAGSAFHSYTHFKTMNNTNTPNSNLYNGNESESASESTTNSNMKKWFYLDLFVVAHGISAVTVQIHYNSYGPTSLYNRICYMGADRNTAAMYLTFGIIPALMCIIVIIVCNILVFIEVFRSISNFVPDINNIASDENTWVVQDSLCKCMVYRDILSRMDHKSREEFVRLIRTPACYLLCSLPIMIVGVLNGIYGIHVTDVGRAISLGPAILIGSMAAILYVYTSSETMYDWKLFLGVLPIEDMNAGSESFDFSGNSEQSQSQSGFRFTAGSNSAASRDIENPIL